MEVIERSRAHLPGSGVIDARTLETDQRHLATVLRPGMRVLDVGCGTGRITRGIASAVGAAGSVVGVDFDPAMIAKARLASAGMTNLKFEQADVYELPFRDEFDLVTSARMLQWLARPADTLARLVAATRLGGRVIVLDYNHEKA